METRTIRLIILLGTFAAGSKSSAQNYRLPIGDCDNDNGRPCYPTEYMYHGGKDWNCGNKTYKRGSYEHLGTDFGIGGFGQMDLGRPVVAAADGVVAVGFDGCEEDKCTKSCCKCDKNKTKNGLGNYVKIEHADGKITLYGHLKTGSIPGNIVVGNPVVCGQVIGEVGSSGCSTGPHLHFEVRLVNGNADDPFSGNCGGPLSYWINQGNYNQLPSTSCTPPTPCAAPNLIIPLANETYVKLTTNLSWFAAKCSNDWADVYRVQVHTGSVFPAACDTDQKACEDNHLITLNATTSNYTTRFAVPANVLSHDTNYYWRVRAGNKDTGAGGAWSSVWKFTTGKRQFACVPSPEICDGKDNDCDNDIDEGCGGGCANGQTRPCYDGKIATWGIGVCKPGTQTCANKAWGTCTGQVLPGNETCNNLDDDCNKLIDDGLTRACNGNCGNGTETCSNGSWVNCDAPGFNSCAACNNTRQCATACGNGIETCQNGNWINCTAPPENSCGTCSNMRACMGNCGAGTEECQNGKWVNCTAPICPQCVPVAEICDGKDNNCNGQVDENLTRQCNGPCGAGNESCNNGNWVNCSAPTLNSCGSCNATRPCATNCGNGIETCFNGAWINCTAPKPAPEVCNKVDDNCNGIVDDGQLCPIGQMCGAGLCVANCAECNAWNGMKCAPVPDGTGCSLGRQCRSGLCVCVGSCKNKVCGDDGCGGSCGNCGHLYNQPVTCENFKCICHPSAEVCDGIDNDCDSQVDNNLTDLWLGQTCCLIGVFEKPVADCMKIGCPVGGYVCGDGKKACSSVLEICNAKDDDCNNLVDDGQICPLGQSCKGGLCL